MIFFGCCHPQFLFESYLKAGYYPFFDGDEEEYYSRIENVVSFIIDQEMTQFCGVDPAYTRKLKAMLLYLADNLPFETNIAKLASYLELNKSTVLSSTSRTKKSTRRSASTRTVVETASPRCLSPESRSSCQPHSKT